MTTSINTHYERIGGEDGVKKLVDRFYDLMDTWDEVKELREIHSPDLARARSTLFDFLSGWLGGPNLFVEKYGHPMLRKRHLHFPIDIKMRDQWLLCMYRAMEEEELEPDLQQALRQSFLKTADHMRNQPE